MWSFLGFAFRSSAGAVAGAVVDVVADVVVAVVDDGRSHYCAAGTRKPKPEGLIKSARIIELNISLGTGQ